MLSYPEPAGLSSLLVAQRDKIRQGTFEAYKLEKILMKKIIALAVATAISAPAMADLTIGASSRYQLDNGGADTAATTNRTLVSVSGSSTAESGVFVSAGATLQLFGTNGSAGVDGNNNIVIGNEAANVAFGATEAAGVYSKGTDAFRVAPAGTLQERVEARNSNAIVLNVTAIEGVTAQLSGNTTNSNMRLVLGADLGGVALSAGIDSGEVAANDAYQLKASASVADVAVTVSYADMDASNTNFVNVGAAYMGFSLNFEQSDVAGTTSNATYGAYSIANAAGVDGFNVTVGAGSADSGDKMGVRFDYAF